MLNRIKVVIGNAKRGFLNTSLSSKRPKEVWRVIHRVIHPSPMPIVADPDQLNYFITEDNGKNTGHVAQRAHQSSGLN